MRILFIGRFQPQDVLGGGQEALTNVFARHMMEDGHEIGKAAFHLRNGKPRKEIVDGMTLFRVKGFRGSFLSRLPGFINVVKEFDPDIVVLTSLEYAMFGVYISKLTGKKVCGLVHDFFDVYGMRKPFNIPFYVNRKLFVPRLAKVISSNNYAAGLVERESKCKVTAGISGIDLPSGHPIKTVYRKYSSKGEPYTFVFIGRFCKEKGVDFLAEAFCSFKERYPNSRVVFVGGGKYLKEFKERWNGVAGIETVGFLKEEDMLKTLSEADVFVTPSYIKEGMVLSNIQAMMVGVPVISTDVGAVSEVVITEETGMLVKSLDKESMVGAMIAYATDSKYSKKMALRAMKYSQKYTGENATKILLEELKNV